MRHSQHRRGQGVAGAALKRVVLGAGACLGIVLGGFGPSGLTVPAAHAFCSDGRVMGGCVTSIETFPWQVSLFRTGGSNRVQAHFCGGTVVAPGWVLTAAHCVEEFVPTDPSPMAVFFGSTSLEEGGQVVDVQTIYTHPDYLGVGADDIALLELRTPISAPTVALVSAENADRFEERGTEAVIAGWGNAPGALVLSGTVGGKGPERAEETVEVFGTSPVLLAAEVPLVRAARCDERGNDEVLCAGFRREQVDACAGDSGGPLLIRDGDQFIQAGIVSGGTLCVDEGDRFTTYTRVSAYEDWIAATLAGETEPVDPRRLPDFSLPATFADTDLIAGFQPDPQRIDLQAGGNLRASDALSGCAGFVADAPDVRITYEAGDIGMLRFAVEGDADTTLLINQPDGSWHCNDDRADGDLNPELVFEGPLGGQYDIWVGTFESPDALGAFPEATLLVTERR
ncbi:MAG: serine protease [Devosiaceae bacterium]|nr:serine protease [Devosiaceae bacterium MH13]